MERLSSNKEGPSKMSKYEGNVGPFDGLTVNNAALLLIDRQVSFMH